MAHRPMFQAGAIKPVKTDDATPLRASARMGTFAGAKEREPGRKDHPDNVCPKCSGRNALGPTLITDTHDKWKCGDCGEAYEVALKASSSMNTAEARKKAYEAEKKGYFAEAAKYLRIAIDSYNPQHAQSALYAQDIANLKERLATAEYAIRMDNGESMQAKRDQEIWLQSFKFTAAAEMDYAARKLDAWADEKIAAIINWRKAGGSEQGGSENIRALIGMLRKVLRNPEAAESTKDRISSFISGGPNAMKASSDDPQLDQFSEHKEWLNGVPIEYTGNTNEAYGSKWYEVRYLDGWKKGNLVVTERAPNTAVGDVGRQVLKAAAEPAKGTRVYGIDGPGGSGRAGTVSEWVNDRWGRHAVVDLDEGGTETVHSGFGDPETDKGIGWYVGDRGNAMKASNIWPEGTEHAGKPIDAGTTDKTPKPPKNPGAYDEPEVPYDGGYERVNDKWVVKGQLRASPTVCNFQGAAEQPRDSDGKFAPGSGAKKTSAAVGKDWGSKSYKERSDLLKGSDVNGFVSDTDWKGLRPADRRAIVKHANK